MKFTSRSLLTEILKTDKGRSVLESFIPCYSQYANWQQMSVGAFGSLIRCNGMDQLDISALLARLNQEDADNGLPSLDELEDRQYRSTSPSPLSCPGTPLSLSSERLLMTAKPVRISLDGSWEMCEDIDGTPNWNDFVAADVPGSIHTALARSGRIPDPTFGRNQEIAVRASYKSWWLRRRFNVDEGDYTLSFCGISNVCEIYLDGKSLGTHEGMFGGPDIPLHLSSGSHELMVYLKAIPKEFEKGGPISGKKPYLTSNSSWKNTVVINNVYGWHYSNLPSLGVWNHVYLDAHPDVTVQNPFVGTVDIASGRMRASVEFTSSKPRWQGEVRIAVSPKNFSGETLYGRSPISSGMKGPVVFDFTIESPHLWWPNGMGEQNLYTFTVEVVPEGGLTGDSRTITFGIRTVTTIPTADGSRPSDYNWRFVINGKPIFIKGTGWCTNDALLDFTRARYDRFLKLAKIQNCQMIRAWGGGMPETDDFYDLCDEYGIMVMQEWPTAWDSHLTQPFDILEDTVVRNTLRIRTHPSLIIYCPGNESANPYGEAIDMMARYAHELDGTRIFHRGEAWGGSVHNYDSYWGRQSLDVHVNLEAKFFGEFGIASLPCRESIDRYLPEEEKGVWPPVDNGAFEYHTPIFGTADDISRLSQMAGYFVPPKCTLNQVIIASQLAQIQGVRHTLERARIRYPYCGGALYYKLNDNFPAMSWSSVDWYGAPKLGHYVFQKSFAPVAAFVLINTINFNGTSPQLPVYVADDTSYGMAHYDVSIRVYDGKLTRVLAKTLSGDMDASIPDTVGHISIEYEDCCTPPLFIVLELYRNGDKQFETFYFFNNEADKGCIFRLPTTQLRIQKQGDEAIVTNEGAFPAVGTTITCPGHSDTFVAYENFLWIEPGQVRRVRIENASELQAWALNATDWQT